MGTPTAYKNIRLATQLISLIIIVANLFLLVYFICNGNFFRVEFNVNMGIFDMQVCFKYTIIINTMLALFASCVINSKVKFYIKTYLLVGFIGMSVLLGFILFLIVSYETIFITQFSVQMGQNQSTRYTVRSFLQCTDYGSSECSLVALQMLRSIRFVFLVVAIGSFVLDFLVYVFARIALMLDSTTPAESRPTFEKNVHVGYDNTSLRQKRFIDPEIRFQTTSISKV